MKRIVCLALLLLTLLFAFGVSVRSVHPSITDPTMYMEVRVLDSAGRGISVDKKDIRFTAGKEEVLLKTRDVPEGNVGHIIVVDTAKYYFGSDYIKEQNIRDMISFYLSRAGTDERVMFVLASNGQPEIVEYMSVSDARNYVPKITMKDTSAARINEAILTAFQYATDPTPGNPAFNSVFIITDPDVSSNEERDFSLADSVALRDKHNRLFDGIVAIPYRQSYIEGTNNTRRSLLNNGLNEFQNFISEVGGTYVEVLQSGNRNSTQVDIDTLRSALADKMTTSNYYTVDFSPLAGRLDNEDDDYDYDFDGPMRPLEVTVTYRGMVSTADVELNMDLLPPPPKTPTPIPEPTFTPAPTPVVYPGQADTMAMQAVRALHKLRYLEHTEYDAFDNECYIAYVDFCENNGIDPSDGIYQNTYDLLLSGNAIPVPEITPEPTPTPAPTPLVAVGQSDATAMQAIRSLYKLNYLHTTSYDEFDNECFIAYMEFCEHNNLDPRDGIYEKGLNVLFGDEAVGIAPPTPEPTPIPDPTIPPEGYALNDADTEQSGGFIAQIQSVLKTLNCYADGATANVGHMDQATIDAVNLYCATYNWRNDRAGGVTKSICQEILTSGPNLVPRAEPEPTAKEKLMNFLTSEFMLFGVTLQMWIPALLCVVLVFAILVLLVLFSGNKEEKPTDKPEVPGGSSLRIHGQVVPAPGPNPPPANDSDAGRAAKVPPHTPPYTPPSPQPRRNTSFSGGADEERTSTGYFGKPIDLRVEFNGHTETTSAELLEGRSFVIGRRNDCDLTLSAMDKDLSRAHLMLLYEGDQIYLRDVSTYHKTTLNGIQVYGNDHNGQGMPVSNGDVIVAGAHRITISW